MSNDHWKPIMTRATLLVLVIVWAAGGCGQPPTSAEVRGRVTIAGKPLPGGLIRFYLRDKSSRWSGATIEADGSYAVPDVPLGACAVTVDTSNLKSLPRPQRLPVSSGGEMPPGTAASSAGEVVYQPIAARYAASATSPLSADVKPGKNILDFQVD